jgi:FixJ family two-component response regulator
MTESITQVLTCEEIRAGFDVLIARFAAGVAERDLAVSVAAEALEAACRLQQERDREKSRADEQAAMARAQATLTERFRIRLEEVHTELRQTRDTCRNLAVANGALEQHRGDRTRRWLFKRTGNSL